MPSPQLPARMAKAQKCAPVDGLRDNRLHSRGKDIIWAAKSTISVGFLSGCLPGVVHSLFKEYYSCARSFSPLLLPAPLSLCRPARAKKLLKPLPPLKLCLRTWRLTPPRALPTLLLLALLLPVQLPKRLATLLRPPVRPLRAPLLLLAMPPRLPAKPLPTLLRRCNLRRTAKYWGAGETSRPFSLPNSSARDRSPLDRFNRTIKLPCKKREENG